MGPHRQVRINVNSEITGCFTRCNQGGANRQTKNGKSLLTPGCSEPHELSLVTIKLKPIARHPVTNSVNAPTDILNKMTDIG